MFLFDLFLKAWKWIWKLGGVESSAAKSQPEPVDLRQFGTVAYFSQPSKDEEPVWQKEPSGKLLAKVVFGEKDKDSAKLILVLNSHEHAQRAITDYLYTTDLMNDSYRGPGPLRYTEREMSFVDIVLP